MTSEPLVFALELCYRHDEAIILPKPACYDDAGFNLPKFALYLPVKIVARAADYWEGF